jgi:hypothetical protein
MALLERDRGKGDREPVTPGDCQQGGGRRDDIVEIAPERACRVGEPVLKVDDEYGRTVSEPDAAADAATRVDRARIVERMAGWYVAAV